MAGCRQGLRRRLVLASILGDGDQGLIAPTACQAYVKEVSTPGWQWGCLSAPISSSVTAPIDLFLRVEP